jgi:hypothetical protein
MLSRTTICSTVATIARVFQIFFTFCSGVTGYLLDCIQDLSENPDRMDPQSFEGLVIEIGIAMLTDGLVDDPIPSQVHIAITIPESPVVNSTARQFGDGHPVAIPLSVKFSRCKGQPRPYISELLFLQPPSSKVDCSHGLLAPFQLRTRAQETRPMSPRKKPTKQIARVSLIRFSLLSDPPSTSSCESRPPFVL